MKQPHDNSHNGEINKQQILGSTKPPDNKTSHRTVDFTTKVQEESLSKVNDSDEKIGCVGQSSSKVSPVVFVRFYQSAGERENRKDNCHDRNPDQRVDNRGTTSYKDQPVEFVDTKPSKSYSTDGQNSEMSQQSVQDLGFPFIRRILIF